MEKRVGWLGSLKNAPLSLRVVYARNEQPRTGLRPADPDTVSTGWITTKEDLLLILSSLSDHWTPQFPEDIFSVHLGRPTETITCTPVFLAVVSRSEMLILTLRRSR